MEVEAYYEKNNKGNGIWQSRPQNKSTAQRFI